MAKLISIKDEDLHYRLKVRALERKITLEKLADRYLRAGFELDLTDLTLAGIRRKAKKENKTPEQILSEFYLDETNSA